MELINQKLKKLPVVERLRRKYEKIYTRVFDSSVEGSKYVAREIANLIREKQKKGEICVLGLATGSSPLGVYRELIRMHKEEGLSFKNVVTFNLDEYYPMEPDHVQSYVYYMYENLFNHIDIPRENINIPDGTVPREKVYEFCQEYEQKIQSYGGLDFQLLGIGRTGHIGFNEPGSDINSPTRLVTLDSITIADAAGDFNAIENVPKQAITMGIGTIFQAKRIILIAWGDKKAEIVKKAVEGPVTDQVPASFLQKHPNTEFVLDRQAAAKLTRFDTPWLVQECQWDDRLMRKASVWLSKRVNKPILKLTNRDYNDNYLGDLLAKRGPAYNINIQVFNDIQHTITGWPGGKPNVDDTYRPERAKPYPKRILIFSPHPDDDVLSMGGTILRLVSQGHDVHVAYQTSGNYSVPDDDVIRFLDFVMEFENAFSHELNIDIKHLNEKVRKFLKNKKPGDIDIPEVRKIKTLVREGDAKSSLRLLGVPEQNIHFLKMPFYETGKIKKKPLSQQDIDIVTDIIRQIKPHQIYAAADLADPHGTHRQCYNAILQAIEAVKDENWFKDCWVWFYKSVWQDWQIADIDMAVPLSPGELDTKKRACVKHYTQRDVIMPDHDNKELWRYAIDRNRENAQTINDLGFAEYEAIEFFARYLPENPEK